MISTITVLQVASSYLGYRFKPIRSLLEGRPIVIIDHGQLVDHNLRRQRLTADDVAEEMRQQQIASFHDVQWGILESNGKMSFIER